MLFFKLLILTLLSESSFSFMELSIISSRLSGCDIVDFGSPFFFRTESTTTTTLSALTEPIINGRQRLNERLLGNVPRIRSSSCTVLVVGPGFIGMDLNHPVLQRYGYREDSFIILFLDESVQSSSSSYGVLNQYHRLNAQVYFVFNNASDYDLQLNKNLIFPQFRFLIPSVDVDYCRQEIDMNMEMDLSSSSLTDDKTFFLGRRILIGWRGEQISVKDTRRSQHHQSHEEITYSSPDDQFIHTASEYFNVTVIYESDVKEMLLSSTSITHEAYAESFRIAGPGFCTFIRDFEDYFLLYCEDELQFEGEDYGYWLMPFDWPTWVLLVMSIVLGAVVSIIMNFEMNLSLLVEKILSNIAIVLRQGLLSATSSRSSSASQIELVLCMCTFLLSIDYESIVTSKMTVPGPPIVAKDLRELVLDWGYKVFFPVQKPEDILEYDHHEFEGGFRKYNLSEVFFESIQAFEIDEKGRSLSRAESLGRKNGKIVTDIAEHEVDYVLEDWKSSLEEEGARFCHLAKEPFFRGYYSRLVDGRGFGRIIRLQFLTLQNGILMWWNHLHKWMENYINKSKGVIRRNSGNKKEHQSVEGDHERFYAVKLNVKVIQIFEIWAFTGSCAVICFVCELAADLVKRRLLDVVGELYTYLA
jgi:hypothetical protein